jgi:hypothetical protein
MIMDKNKMFKFFMLSSRLKLSHTFLVHIGSLSRAEPVVVDLNPLFTVS